MRAGRPDEPSTSSPSLTVTVYRFVPLIPHHQPRRAPLRNGSKSETCKRARSYSLARALAVCCFVRQVLCCRRAAGEEWNEEGSRPPRGAAGYADRVDRDRADRSSATADAAVDEH